MDRRGAMPPASGNCDSEGDCNGGERAPTTGSDCRPPADEDEQAQRQPDADRFCDGTLGIDQTNGAGGPHPDCKGYAANQKGGDHRPPDAAVYEGGQEIRPKVRHPIQKGIHAGIILYRSGHQPRPARVASPSCGESGISRGPPLPAPLQSRAAEFAITIANAEVWLSIGPALLLGGVCLAFGTWAACTVGLLQRAALYIWSSASCSDCPAFRGFA
jgi:hypothetical protein